MYIYKEKRPEGNTPKYYQWFFFGGIMGDNDI